MKRSVSVKLKGDFVREEGETLVVGINATPEKGKANIEVIRKLSKYLKVPQSAIRIVAGSTTRKKVVEIHERYGKK